MLIQITCAACDVNFGMTEEMYERRLHDGVSFRCPNGHSNIYRPSQNETQREKIKELEGEVYRLRRERNSWRSEWYNLHDEFKEVTKERTTALLRAAGYKSQWLKEKHRREDMEATNDQDQV